MNRNAPGGPKLEPRPPRPPDPDARKPKNGHCGRCWATVAQCLRIGEHYPYRACCKACDHGNTNERNNP